MEYNILTNLSYCYSFFEEAQGLLFYTHIPPIFISILFATFILFQRRDKLGILLGAIALFFSAFATIDLLQWILIDSSSFIMASRSVLGILTALLFLFSHWFVHEFAVARPLPRWMTAVWLLAFLPIFVFTPTRFNISGYDIRDCIAIENPWFTNYYYALGLLAIILMVFSVFGSRKSALLSRNTRLAQNLVFTGSTLFVLSFLVTGVLASYLVDQGYLPDFGLAQYGVAAMSVFIGFLAYVTAYYRGFNVKVLAAQILVAALIILIASQFLFVRTSTNRILVSITFALSTVFGVMLIRSVQREVKQRELIEKQEKDLEHINKQQENLLAFISHEVKGYLAKSQAAFAGIVQGDYGEVPARLKTMADSGLTDMRKGVDMVSDILEASNLRKGTVSYEHHTFDFKQAIDEVISDLTKTAAQKGLELHFSSAAGDYRLMGDEAKMRRHVIRNLIDNSIHYTQQGSITVSLSRNDSTIHFSVKDTGIGISKDDMQNLFTEGGHGKESLKVNADSTGYGLFIAKQVTEAHGGKIWAESKGAGAGSKFIVELPVT